MTRSSAVAKSITALAPAKLNLTFDILGSLPDGYHEVSTLLQAIELTDQLRFRICESDRTEVSINCETPFVSKSFPADKSNLISRAAQIFSETTGLKFKLEVSVEKNIPIGAGLAGGSSDAAATIVALNELFGNAASKSQMLEMAAKLGADVPFCIDGGCQIGTHRGDRLQPIENKMDLHFCIIKPKKISVSTPWAYQKYDQFKGRTPHPNANDAATALKNSDLETAMNSFGNAFEPVIFAEYPQLAELKAELERLGCWATHLSGSGPALYAVVANREMAHFVRRKLLKNDDAGFEYGTASSYYEFGPQLNVFIAQSITYGVELRQDPE